MDLAIPTLFLVKSVDNPVKIAQRFSVGMDRRWREESPMGRKDDSALPDGTLPMDIPVFPALKRWAMAKVTGSTNRRGMDEPPAVGPSPPHASSLAVGWGDHPWPGQEIGHQEQAEAQQAIGPEVPEEPPPRLGAGTLHEAGFHPIPESPGPVSEAEEHHHGAAGKPRGEREPESGRCLVVWRGSFHANGARSPAASGPWGRNGGAWTSAWHSIRRSRRCFARRGRSIPSARSIRRGCRGARRRIPRPTHTR